MLRMKALTSVGNGRMPSYIRARLYHTNNGVFGYLPERASAPEPPVFPLVNSLDDCRRLHFINAFRRHGYRRADLDPLHLKRRPIVHELKPQLYGLDPETELKDVGVVLRVSDLAAKLESLYCEHMTAEFMHIKNWEERSWFACRFEEMHRLELRPEERHRYAESMLKSQNFDNFLALKFPTVKRYGCEGAESMFPFFIELFDSASSYDIEDLTICMAHRGRLNLLCELMHFPPVQLFRKIRGKLEFPEHVQGVGDVLSHFTSSFDHKTSDGTVHIMMMPNPSHLEAVNPVAMGRTRARMLTKKKGDYGPIGGRNGDGVLCVQVHGDGSFTGQGTIWETLAMSQTPHFRLGGSIHMVINNQLAYTAESNISRSSDHTTDIAKAIDAPIIHVNGDYPDLVAKATRILMEYRHRYRKDVFLNLLCYRRWGHNELDDPHFTQPIMYKEVDARKSIPDLYADELMDDNVMREEEKKTIIDAHTEYLNAQLRVVDQSSPVANHLKGNWSGMIQAPHSVETWDTGVDIDLLRFIGAKSVAIPDGFAVNEHLQKVHIASRIAKMESGTGIEWSTAEALAFGSLLLQGYDVRISGQDVGRGTFSQRHAMLVDQKTDEAIIPLNNMIADQKNFIEVANSLLSEEAVLGYEFGFSMEHPRRLCIWEAQFGDFFNGAQIIIDTFVASAESKWLTQSGLVMILPHGIDGMGPEHSTCRMERFLQLCNSREDQAPADGESVNIHIVNPTTSAQYFHLLRKQVITPYRKPLIIVGPKILLRHPMAASTLYDMKEGTHFQPVIGDDSVSPADVTKVIFCSGKHCYALRKEREARKLNNVAIIRLEQLCPFPVEALRTAACRYPDAKVHIWSQEEARNAGAWSFVRPRFANALGIGLKYCGRPEMAWAATPISSLHEAEFNEIIDDTFAA
uniref:2-oxoglutarate dehydrogenase E1 component n=1 Tax=Ascaris suum TaxID=6253 RepID=F1KTQ9_ASCSU